MQEVCGLGPLAVDTPVLQTWIARGYRNAARPDAGLSVLTPAITGWPLIKDRTEKLSFGSCLSFAGYKEGLYVQDRNNKKKNIDAIKY